jgi:uncharacterized peroxidase-related enzyme
MKAVELTAAGAEATAALAESKRQFGAVINLFRVAANAPNVLAGVLAMNKALGSGIELAGKEVEQVAMLVSALNRCDYCVNVHMQVGKSQGLTEHDMLEAMAGRAEDPKSQALLTYANEVVRSRGLVSAKTLGAVRAAGFSDKALLEVIGVIGIYTTLQYIRHVADPAHDFPEVKQFKPELHGA